MKQTLFIVTTILLFGCKSVSEHKPAKFITPSGKFAYQIIYDNDTIVSEGSTVITYRKMYIDSIGIYKTKSIKTSNGKVVFKSIVQHNHPLRNTQDASQIKTELFKN